MKKILREVSFLVIPFFLIIVLLFFFNIFKKDFIYGHYLHSTYKDPLNWFNVFIKIPINKTYLKFRDNKKKNLPQTRLYISQANLNYLLSNPPNTTKIWQKARITKEKNIYNKKIKLRLRGDNPDNWLFEKKSFKIKFKKSEMNGRYRYYNYLPFEIRHLTGYRLARSAKIYAPKAKPIELIVNEEKKGLYLEVEELNENFLRRNKIMPVNFYKGENYNQEAKVGLNVNLFNNSGLWSKEAYFNFYTKEYKADLKKFLRSLKEAKNNLNDFKKFVSYIDEDYFGRYLAYLIISQDYHSSIYHNNRIIIDPWKGKVFPVIIDPGYMDLGNEAVNLERSSQDLQSILNQSSKFIDLKYKYLKQFILDEKLLINQINYLKLNKKKFIEVLRKDPVNLNIISNILGNNNGYELIDKEINRLKLRNMKIEDELNKPPNSSWKMNNEGFSIVIADQMPISNIKLFFEKDTPNWVFIDENYNGKYDPQEIKYFKDINNFILLDVSLYSNRINTSTIHNLFRNNIITGVTKFNFISSNGATPNKIFSENKFFKKKILIPYNKEKNGAQSNLLNQVVYKVKDKKIKTFSGDIKVKKTLIFEEVVKILPGSTFYLSDGASIIFKNKIEAIGTFNKKIKFILSKNSHKSWGTIAIIGKNTSGSIIEHVELNGGSGHYNEQYYFTGMLSIHNNSNIKLKNINFLNNDEFDDMLHVVYSKNVLIDNLSFENASADAIDIDNSSNVIISNSTFVNSKNDGIDLMESDVLLKNNLIKNSGDKGVSVGESSLAKIMNTNFDKNFIGVAVKDNSKAFIINSKFLDNKSQIESYKKNLQYGSGGKVKVTESIFNSKINNFLSNKSSIKIENSKMIGITNLQGNVILN